MEKKEREHIMDLVAEYNPHLLQKELEVPGFKREEYPRAMKALNDGRILALLGPRGAGKTTMMKQMLNEVKDGLFFSFEREETRKRETLKFIIELTEKKGLKYLFLDEIQFLQSWEEIIHTHLVSKKSNLRIVISSSQFLGVPFPSGLLKNFMALEKIPPLSFRDFLRMKGVYVPGSIPEGTSEYAFLKQMYGKMDRKRMENLFREYLFKGGFPKLVNETDEDIIRDYIVSLATKVIFFDIPHFFDVRKPNKIYDMLHYIATNSGNILNISLMMKELDINKRTAKRYMHYLHITFLVRIYENYSELPRERMKKIKKAFVIHPTMAIQLSGVTMKKLESNSIISGYVESLLDEEYLYKHKDHIFYISHSNTSFLTLDVDYSNPIDDKRAENLFKFMEDFGSHFGAIVTKNRLKKLVKKEKSLMMYMVPAWILFTFRN